MEPFSAFSTLGSSLTATVTAANFIFALHNTPNDVRACAQLVTRVYDDLQFLITLRNSHQEYLEASPIERQRLDGIIAEAAKSLLAIGRKLEDCRAEANGGKVPLMGRMKWILGDSASFVLHSRNLGVQQAAINSEINWLRNLRQAKGKEKEESKVVEAVFENLELLKLSSKKSMLFREPADPRPAPPPYQENPAPVPSMDTGQNDVQRPPEKFGWIGNDYLEPERRTSYPSFRAESRLSPVPGHRASTPNIMLTHNDRPGTPNESHSSTNQSSQHFSPESMDQLNTSRKNSQVERKRSSSNLESHSPQLPLSLQQLPSQRGFFQPASTSFTPPPLRQAYSDTVGLQQSQVAQRRESYTAHYPASRSNFSSPAPTITPYPSFDTPVPPFAQLQRPAPLPRPMSAVAPYPSLTPKPEFAHLQRSPPPAVPPKDMRSFRQQLPDTFSPFNNNVVSDPPNPRPCEEVGTREWCPAPEISNQLSYMPTPTPTLDPKPSTTPVPTFSEEKIAISYVPFSYKAGPDQGYAPIGSPSSPAELYPEPLALPRRPTKPTRHEIEDGDKMTVSSLDSTPTPRFSLMSDFDKEIVVSSNYTPASILSSSTPAEKEVMTYSSYSPPRKPTIGQAEKESLRYSNCTPTPLLSPITQVEKEVMTYSSYSHPPTIPPISQAEKESLRYSNYAPTPIPPSSQAEQESDRYSSYAPTPVMSPVSFAGRQSVVSLMSFTETQDTGQYNRSVSRQTLRSEELPRHDDPEEAFFRDLRMQEIEKRSRIASIRKV
ncbi:uncharacterized protein PAC_00119 [Phialocephala subalpina]|uniref:Uncharacterized protein n=1 Tax=Phialocephala subalpina TaxID=576137 RepID=A0A1L7WBU0_9HELO|nr:uncharacterized protein PAC_00119 [Phialocephala subalpina]